MAPPSAEGRPDDEELYEDEDDGYSLDHLSAVLRPVALTMVLASIAVSKIREASIDSGISNGLSAYLVYNQGTDTGSGGGGGGESTGTLIGQALINAIVIVCVIAAATFVLVACYYFRLLKLMVAYLVFASMNLLGYSGGFMAVTAIAVWKIPVDWATLGFIMLNFAVGGVVAVFWQKGVPRAITQGYLIAVSVIMAWILTKLPEWTSWALLVALAVYDLCAVLTPCGPLKWLVNLAQKRQDPIPGLLYEANVGDTRNSAEVRDTLTSGSGARRRQPPSAGGSAPSATGPKRQQQAGAVAAAGATAADSDGDGDAQQQRELMQQVRQQVREQRAAAAEQSTPRSGGDVAVAVTPHGGGGSTPASQVDADAALAARLQLEEVAGGGGGGDLDAAAPDWAPPTRSPAVRAGSVGRGGGSGGFTAAPSATAPRRSSLGSQRKLPPALEADGHAEPLVGPSLRGSSDGGPASNATAASAADDAAAAAAEEEAYEDVADRSIKLGLGDFVFYSVLVSRAALFDVSTFAATFVAVLLGLGGTLFLLGIFRMALPALPISIFLGVALYFITRLAITPMIIEMSLNGAGL